MIVPLNQISFAKRGVHIVDQDSKKILTVKIEFIYGNKSCLPASFGCVAFNFDLSVKMHFLTKAQKTRADHIQQVKMSDTTDLCCNPLKAFQLNF